MANIADLSKRILTISENRSKNLLDSTGQWLVEWGDADSDTLYDLLANWYGRASGDQVLAIALKMLRQSLDDTDTKHLTITGYEHKPNGGALFFLQLGKMVIALDTDGSFNS